MDQKSIVKHESGEVVAFNVALPSEDAVALASKELKGLAAPQPQRIKVPAGGGLVFEIPTDDPNCPDTVKELRCIVLAHHPINRFYLRGMEDGDAQEGAAPDCMSYDGESGTHRETGEVMSCGTCDLNQFGSGKNGKGKACSNRHRLYLMLENEPIPYILEVPPTSLKGLGTYLYNLIYRRGRGSPSVVTKLTLKKAEGGSGVKYSEVQFAFAGNLPDNMARAAMRLGESIEQKAKAQNTLLDD